MSAKSRREIVVNGLRYYVGPYNLRADRPNHFKGFSGRRFTVRFHDGELLQVDDLQWDYSHKNHSRPDTGVILEGWTDRAPICGWQKAGDYTVFGPLR